MKSRTQISEEWIDRNKFIFNKSAPTSVFLNPAWVEQIVESILNYPNERDTLVKDILQADRAITYPITYLLHTIDQLYEIAMPSEEIQKNAIRGFRDALILGHYNRTLMNTGFVPQQPVENWEINSSNLTPPDIYKILSDILELLIHLTGSDQGFLYLADFFYQAYNPFMALGHITTTQKKAFFEEAIRPDTDILLSTLIKNKEPVILSPDKLKTLYPSYLYQALNINHALALPIRIEDRILGFILLNIAQNNLPLPYSKEIASTAESITGAMALALENSRLYEITHQRLAESQSIYQITLAMLQSFHLNEVLEMICENAISLTQGIGSAVHLLQEDQKILKRASYCGFLIHQSDMQPLQDSFLKAALHTLEPIIINKSVIDQRLPDGSKFSVLAIPLSIHLKPVGVLDIIKKRNKFTPDDIRIIKIFADQAAMAIEHANLYQQAGLAAKHEERQKMARNLHDSVNQNLYAILLYSRTAKMLISAQENDKAIETIDQLKSTTKEALNDLRIFIHELRPPLLEEEGLVFALRRRLETVEEKLGFDVHVTYPNTLPPIPIDIQEGFYRIAQEALYNIVKHAKSDKILVTIEWNDDLLLLRIEDNGIGYDKSITQGFGLKSMQERANLMNATLSVHSERNSGTVVEVEVNL